MKKVLFWFAAFLITLGSAVFQRLTGPTYPVRGVAELDGTIRYKFPRSHAGAGDQLIELAPPSPEIEGTLVWRRYGIEEPWRKQPMVRQESRLTATLPHQPPAGKLEYHVELQRDGQTLLLPDKENVVIRFRNDVPAWALIPHILLMFAAMLFSTAAGLAALIGTPTANKVKITLLLLFLGGFVFGPLVQKFAFAEYWTGLPFGTDLTDNKTLVAFVAWLVAFLRMRKPKGRAWIFAAALITLIAFLVPHSLHGSQLDYSKMGEVSLD